MGRALERASRKSADAGVQVKYYQGDVTRLGNLPLRGPFDLLLDLGCFHGLPPPDRAAYVQGIAALSKPGSVFLLYAFTPRKQKGREIGITPEQVKAVFAPAFTCEQVEFGKDTISAWYTLRRTED
jgi:methyltransferase family protein